jgi:general secretion pathway protein I
VNGHRHHDARGFTLIEVMVALLVVALGIGALLATIASSADTVGRLRDKSFAQWIALNQIALLRLSGKQPEIGITHGDVDYGGSHWKWEQEVLDPGVAGILRVEVRVALQPAGKSAQGTSTSGEREKFPAIASGFGFVGSSVMRASGIDPDWSIASGAQRNPGGGGGGGGGDGDGGGPAGPGPQGTRP